MLTDIIKRHHKELNQDKISAIIVYARSRYPFFGVLNEQTRFGIISLYYSGHVTAELEQLIRLRQWHKAADIVANINSKKSMFVDISIWFQKQGGLGSKKGKLKIYKIKPEIQKAPMILNSFKWQPAHETAH